MKLSTFLRAAVALGAFCVAVCAPSFLAVRAQSSGETAGIASSVQVVPDRSSPAATLRAFTAALTRADLDAAAQCVEGAKLPGTFARIEAAMRQGRTEYSIDGEPQVEVKGEDAQALFFFDISRPPNKMSLSSRAVLQKKDGVWKIDVARTFRRINGVTQWTAFLALLTGQSLREASDGPLQHHSSHENRRAMIQMQMLRVLGEAAMSLAQDRGRFDLRAGDVRGALRPYFPPLDAVLGMDASTRIHSTAFSKMFRRAPQASRRSCCFTSNAMDASTSTKTA